MEVSEVASWATGTWLVIVDGDRWLASDHSAARFGEARNGSEDDKPENGRKAVV